MEINTKSTPFKFLDAYEKQDIDIFFGRNNEIKQLYNQVYYTDLILVYGLTGTGKSSLIQCGLANIFEEADWLPIFIRKESNIIESLEKAIYEKARSKDHLNKRSICDQVHSLYLDYYRPIYLLFDQFEEIFILGSTEEQNNFFWLISELLQSNLQCKIIFIMREEYLAHLDRFEKLIPTLFDNRFRIEHMRLDQIEEVVIQTAANSRFSIQLSSKQIVHQILANVKNEQNLIDLGNLQVYLDRLYRNDLNRINKNKESRPIRFDQDLLNETGQLDDVLGLFLDEQLQIINKGLSDKFSLNPDINITLSILAELVTNQETKQVKEVEEIKINLRKNKNVSPAYTEYCIQKMMEMRILRELT